VETRCRPGDLAIIVFAQYPSNLGLIVRVVRRHSGRGKLAIQGAGPLWTVESAQPMKYTLGEKTFLRKQGPVPDSYMRPVRGDRAPDSHETTRRMLEVA